MKMDDGVSRIYVESPIFTEDDKNTFKFVNPDIDQSEDTTERNINDSTARLLQSENVRRHSIDLDRYEDVNESVNSSSSRLSSAKHSRNQNESSPNIQRSTSASVHVREKTPSEHKFHQELRDEDVDELLLAERHLLQQKQGERSNVPHLDLIDSEDERVKPSRHLDLEINEGLVLPHINKSVPDSVERKLDYSKVSRHDNSLNSRGKYYNSDQIYGEHHDESSSRHKSSANSHQYSDGLRVLGEDENNQNRYNSKLVYQETQNNHSSSAQYKRLNEERVRSSDTSQTRSTWELRGWSDNGRGENHSENEKLRARDEKKHRALPSSVPVKNFISENRNTITGPHQTKKTYGQLYAKKRNKHSSGGETREGQEKSGNSQNVPQNTNWRGINQQDINTGESQSYTTGYNPGGDVLARDKDHRDIVRHRNNDPDVNNGPSRFYNASGSQGDTVQRTHYSKPTAAEAMWRLRAETLEKQLNLVQEIHSAHDAFALYSERRSEREQQKVNGDVGTVHQRSSEGFKTHSGQQRWREDLSNNPHPKMVSREEAERFFGNRPVSFRPEQYMNPPTIYDPGAKNHLSPQHAYQVQVKGGIPNSAVSPRKNRISNVEGIVNGDGETIHHIITTDDGQKVSVDINLRILSPRTSDQYNSPHNHPNNEGIYPTEQSTKMSPVHHPSGSSKAATGGYGQKVRGADVKQSKVLKGSHAPREVPPGPQYLAGIQVQAPNAYTDGGYVPGGYSYHGRSEPHAKSTVPVTESRSQYIYYTPNANSAPTERQNYLSPSFQIPNQIQHSATSMQHNSFHDQSTQPVQKFNEQPKTFQFHPGLPVSPYKVLPPVSNTSELTGLRSPKFHAGGSYLDQYQRTKNRQAGGDYHEYTLVDYKKLQKEIKYTPLGTLGPDLESEELREKREKTMRQLEYARNIKKRHLANIRAAREKELEALEQRGASPITTEGIRKMEEAKDEKLSNFNSASGKRELKVGENNCEDTNGEKHSGNISEKRRLALDYAKRVRKPKVRQRSSAPTEGLPSSQRGSFPLGGLNKEDNGKKTVGAWTPQETSVGDVSVDAEELLRLQQRHEHERNDVAALLLHT